jgi:nucleoside-diphosphate-sugar epimerase
MRILVLGGTAWLGGVVAAEAAGRGHDVTCLARGESGSAPAGAGWVRADRDRPGAYDVVAGQTWDAVVDVTRHPGHARGAVAALAEQAAFFVFVSTGNVYADHATPGTDESAPLLPPLDGDRMDDMEEYGEAKVACEEAVLAGFGPDRCAVARAGLIGGPGDTSGRTGYWPLRLAHPAADDGRVLVPDTPDQATQVVDVRDLARWLVDLAERRTAGVFNATGETTTFAEHLSVAREVAGHTGALVAMSPAWLSAHDVEVWMGARSLPLWLPMPEYAGFVSRDSSAARAAGLRHRPLAETLRDTLAWELEQGVDRARRAGLSAADERELLAAADAEAG